MAKDPAVLFYPNDWIGGTMGMTFAEKGAYMELLMMQFNRGHMTYDMIAHVLGQSGGQNVDELWSKLKHKFVQDENGLWYNRRFEIEKIKRANYVESRSNNKSGKNQHTQKEQKNRSYDQTYDQSHEKDMTIHTEGRMENENENKDSIGGVGEKKGVGEAEDFSVEYPSAWHREQALKNLHEKKNKFNTKPIYENFNGLPELKIESALEAHSLVFGVGIVRNDVIRLWNVFKVENLTGENFYGSEEKVYTHFLRWIRKQPLNKPTKINPQTTKPKTDAKTMAEKYK